MTSRFIIESFWQKAANCACVAFMKVLLMEYGFSGGFKIKKQGKFTIVGLEDGSVHSFSNKELAENNQDRFFHYRKYSGTRGKDVENIKQFVHRCFAVLIRSMQVQGFNGKEYTRTTAIKALTKEGIETQHFHSLLGLKRKKSYRLSNKRLSYLKKKGPVLIFNSKHIVAAAGGYYDNFGEALPLNEVPVLLGKKASSWYRIR